MVCDAIKLRGKGNALGERDAGFVDTRVKLRGKVIESVERNTGFVDTRGRYERHVHTPQTPGAITSFAVSRTTSRVTLFGSQRCVAVTNQTDDVPLLHFPPVLTVVIVLGTLSRVCDEALDVWEVGQVVLLTLSGSDPAVEP